jgi:hypothetical protein
MVGYVRNRPRLIGSRGSFHGKHTQNIQKVLSESVRNVLDSVVIIFLKKNVDRFGQKCRKSMLLTVSAGVGLLAILES